MRRNKVLSIIKITGLSVGIATFILGVRYVQFEKTFDKHNSKFDRIYRVQNFEKDDKADVGDQCPSAMSRYMNSNIPEVQQAVMFTSSDQFFSTLDNRVFFEDRGAYVEKEFFRVFDFDFISGDPETVLAEPNSIVISEKLAKKFFPGEQPLGKTILDEQKRELEITGVYKDLPANSHRRMEYLLPFYHYHKGSYTNWGNFSYYCYALLKPGVDKADVDQKIAFLKDNYDKNNKTVFFLHPLGEVHLRPYLSNEYMIVLVLTSVICLLILILSAVNYMNLSTAYSSTRSKEIGVRKVTGSRKSDLRIQYFFESVLYAVLAFLLALVLAKIAIHPFGKIVDRDIDLSYLSNIPFLLIIFSSVVLIGFISGIYPAFIMSSFKPIMVLKGFGPFGQGKSKSYGLKTMVCIQFILSAILISSTVWVYKNVNYLKNKDLGFDKSDLLHCKIPSNNKSQITYLELKNRIKSHPGIESFCLSKNAPLINVWGTGAYFEGQDANQRIYVSNNPTGKDYLETYKIELVKGRNFYEDFAANRNTVLINETCVRKSGWKGDPVGKWIFIRGSRHKVVGVFKDIIMDDMHNSIRPYILVPHDGDINASNNFTFRVNPKTLQSSFNHIRQIFSEAFPGVVFEIYAYDDAIDDEAIRVWSSVKNTFGFFTIIAIIIAGFGLFALIVFSVQKRFKEIGVRKVQGAKLPQIYSFLLNEFFVLFLIASVFTLPIPEIMIRTMPGAYKYQMQPWDYIFICLISLMVILISGSYNAIKASMMNPTEALKYE